MFGSFSTESTLSGARARCEIPGQRETRLRADLEGDLLRFREDGAGAAATVVIEIDGENFTETWLAAVERAQL